jgi:protein-S-isoprenylcysteine O-methyltransferase Ste14
MNNKTFTALVILCLITHIIRTTYEILKHKKILAANKLSFAIMFTNMAVLWISWFLLCGADVYKINLPAVVRYIGLALTILGAGLFFTALFTIKTLETYSGDLITKGIYSKVRHPMYLGFICWLLGGPLFFNSVISFALAVLFIANVFFWRHLEELELEKRFAGYKEYKAKTLF